MNSHELILANKELAFQNKEKEKRAAELVIANKELAFQIDEKEKRAAELVIANKELAFQNREKEKRAAELVIANKELAFQNDEKEKRAAELVIANKELAFQNREKEKRTIELMTANKELESFIFISSHDLQEPLRKIQIFTSIILEQEFQNMSAKNQDYFIRIKDSTDRMRCLIDDISLYSSTKVSEKKFENAHLKPLVEKVVESLNKPITNKKAIIVIGNMTKACIIPDQFQLLLHNLVDNSIKFSDSAKTPLIRINSQIINYSESNHLPLKQDYCHITISDNGIGFEPHYQDKIFEVFQQLHDKSKYTGTGIGLAIAKKIVENHNGVITATGNLNEGASFDVYIPLPH